MIFITARFRVLPEHADRWPEISGEFTRACRAEPGCLWFDWFRGVDDPNEYALTEAFRDGDAGAAHVQSEHFKKASRRCRRTSPRRPGSSTRRFRKTTGPSSARWPCPTAAEPPSPGPAEPWASRILGHRGLPGGGGLGRQPVGWAGE